MHRLLCLLLMAFAGPAAAQTADPARLLAQHDYLLKSNNQRHAANVMLVMGGSVAITSAVGIASTFQNSNLNPSYLVWERLMMAGLGVVAVSIPLFIAARHNRQQAAAIVGLQLEANPAPPGLANGPYPALPMAGLRLSF